MYFKNICGIIYKTNNDNLTNTYTCVLFITYLIL